MAHRCILQRWTRFFWANVWFNRSVNVVGVSFASKEEGELIFITVGDESA